MIPISVKLSVNNDYIGNDGSLDEKKAEEKVAAVRETIKDMTAIELWQKIVESEIGDLCYYICSKGISINCL